MTEREFAVDVVRRLREAGFQALWAGGCVRDQLLGLVPKDYDAATDARPEQVRKVFHRTVAIGMSFGVVEVLGPRTAKGPLKVQVTTFRSDMSYSDGRHPDKVVFSSPKEDALRRDFTINGMFFDPLENRLIDYVGGQEDLGARRLRAIGEPKVRFAEDKLRMLRAVRIATAFELTIEPLTAAAIQGMADQIAVVSAERIAEELRRLMASRHRARGIQLLDEVGLAKAILPELSPMKESGDTQWHHVLKMLDNLGPDSSFPLAFAALLHGIGKTRSVARRMAAEICHRLKLSNTERDRFEWLVEKHGFLADPWQMRLCKLKETLAHAGIHELLALHRADAVAWGRSSAHVDFCEQLLRQWSAADLNPAPLLTGNDLVALRGLKPGPLFGQLLQAIREAQLDETVSTREQALDLVDRWIAEQGAGGTRNIDS